MNEEYKNEMTISVDFTVKTDQHDSDEMISCYMPEINVYFSAKKPEDIPRKAAAFVKIWVNHWNNLG